MSALARVGPDKFDQREVIETLKQTVCKGATDAQLKLFIEVARATGLNPFLKGEIWYVPEKNMIMAGRDGYLRVANENPNFDGIETRVERDEKNVPIKAVCTVWRKDRTHPTICEAYFSEYRKNSPVWQQYPSAMIGKVSEVLALKRSFAINGVVSEEEVGHDGTGSVEAAQAVAARKIAEINERKAAVVDIAPALPAPPSEAYQKLVAAFAELKARAFECGLEETYDAALSQCGVTSAEDFDDTKEGIAAARKCFKITGQALSVARNPEPQDALFPEGFSIEACVKLFTEVKEQIFNAMGASAGELEYRRILQKHGAASSNKFRSSEKATPCYLELVDALKQIDFDLTEKK